MLSVKRTWYGKAAQEPLQKGYGLLLGAVLEHLGCFAEPWPGRHDAPLSALALRFQNMRWLENKKQLLVYHHAARVHEQRDSILASLAGAPDVGQAFSGSRRFQFDCPL